MKKNMTAIALAYNSYANWIKIDSANAEQREHENQPKPVKQLQRNNLTARAELYNL